MTTTVIYNNFKPAHPFKNRYRRAEYELWDANIHHSDVRPFACPIKACDNVPAQADELYPLPECKCNYFEELTDPHLGFCPDQHFFILNGQLQQATTDVLCDNQAPCLAGVPFQPSAPGVSSGCSGCDSVGVAYVITYVSLHAGVEVEGPPSPSSDLVASSGHIPNASVSWGAAPAGYCVVATRLYRVESTYEDGTTQAPNIGSEYVFVAQFDNNGAAGGFTDNVPTSETGGPLDTYDPMRFPAPDGILHMTRTEDSVVVADENRVYIGYPGEPQFPYEGVVNVEHKIRGLESIGNTIFVFTESWPVKITYRVTDGVMSVDRQTIKRRLPLRSKKSLGVYDDKVFFSSTYSLYSWDISGYGSDIKKELQEVMTPEQWKHIDPDSVTGTGYEFGYIFSSDSIDYSIMLQFHGDGTDIRRDTVFMPISYINGESFTTDYDGVIVYKEGDKIYCWDWRRDVCNFELYDNNYSAFCSECCPWRASFYFDNEGKNRFNKMRIEWDERSATHLNAEFWLSQFGKEQMVADFKVISSRGFSIPKFSSSQTFIVKVAGCGIMHEVRFATSNQELVSSSNQFIENGEEQ